MVKARVLSVGQVDCPTLALVTMTVWDELKVVLLELEGSGTLVVYPDPRVDDNRQPPFQIHLQPGPRTWPSHCTVDSVTMWSWSSASFDTRSASRRGSTRVREMTIPDMDPTLMTVELDAPIVVASGHTVRGALRVHNLSADTIVVCTNGHVTAQVLDPDTRAVVGCFAGGQILPGIYFRAAPGETVVVPVLVGTASFSPDLGYVVPAGGMGNTGHSRT